MLALVLLAGLLAAGILAARGKARRRVRALSPDEAAARQLLGVSVRASRAEIIAAHRRCIGRIHPDHGQNAASGQNGDLAARVNAARDLLLSRA